MRVLVTKPSKNQEISKLKQSNSVLRSSAQTGSILVTVVVIVIIVVVLFFLWQAGTFSGSDPAQSTNTDTSASAAENVQDSEGVSTQPGDGAPRVADQQPQVTTQEPLVQKPTGKEPEGITKLANELIAAHRADMSVCRTEADPIKALQCASGIQSTALANVFEDYEARRAAGDLVANSRGGEVLKLVVAELSAKLKPFQEAADLPLRSPTDQ